MQTHTVSQNQWKTIFDSLSRVYDGSRATMEVLDAELGAQHEVDDQPFRGISYDPAGIELHFMMGNGRHVTHRIPRPKEVRIEEADNGLVVGLAIESDNDPQVVLQLHAPVPSHLLTRGEG